MRPKQPAFTGKTSFNFGLSLILLMAVPVLLSSCASLSESDPTQTLPPPTLTPTRVPPSETPIPTATMTVLSPPYQVWIDPTLPGYLIDSVSESDQLSISSSEGTAQLIISTAGDLPAGSWYFLAVAPFYSPLDGLAFNDIRGCWSNGWDQALPFERIHITDTTLEILSILWGDPSQDCIISSSEGDITQTLWVETNAIALILFEELEPSLKVLEVEGIDPLSRSADFREYPLSVDLFFQIPAGVQLTAIEGLTLTNFDPDYLSVVALTGVTALVRDTAAIMETEGVSYPAGDIEDLLSSADITHISNEVPFAVDCPTPDASQVSLTFCSSDSYLELLETVGTDIVELSGDHFGDWGPDAMLHTIELYEDQGWAIYGGGRNLAEGLEPVFLTDHGNRFAFIGCNGKGIAKYATATADNPGASQCDYNWMTAEISRLAKEGYLVIATMQHEEVDSFWPIALQQYDFRRLAEAGAVVVSGSQAHHPQGFEFHNGSFIHYGLGNLFFDQWYLANYNPKSHINKDKAFIDLHYFYQGRHLGTRLVPLQFIDNARPRPMTLDEQIPFLAEVYQASRWEEDWIYLYSTGIIRNRMD